MICPVLRTNIYYITCLVLRFCYVLTTMSALKVLSKEETGKPEPDRKRSSLDFLATDVFCPLPFETVSSIVGHIFCSPQDPQFNYFSIMQEVLHVVYWHVVVVQYYMPRRCTCVTSCLSGGWRGACKKREPLHLHLLLYRLRLKREIREIITRTQQHFARLLKLVNCILMEYHIRSGVGSKIRLIMQ